MLPRNLGECFVSFLFEPITGNNVSPSDKQLWRFLKNFLVAEKSQCKGLSVNRHLEISSLLLMSAEKHRNANFCILIFKLCFLGFVHLHNEFFFSYTWSFVYKFTRSEET